jgi:outer membrane protein
MPNSHIYPGSTVAGMSQFDNRRGSQRGDAEIPSAAGIAIIGTPIAGFRCSNGWYSMVEIETSLRSAYSPHAAASRLEAVNHSTKPFSSILRSCLPLSLLFLLASTRITAWGADIPAQLTLTEALHIALANSSIIREAMARLDESSGQYRQARSALLPQLDAYARQSFQTINLLGLGIDFPTPDGGERAASGLIGPFGSMDARVWLNQDLFNLATVRAWRSYRWRRESSSLLVEDAREVVALNVVAAYLQALQAKSTRDTLAEQAKLANELYGITRERVGRGVSAELDANRAMQKVNTLEQQWQEASQSYIAAKLALANILQAHITANFEVADEAAYGEGAPPNGEAAITAALAMRADYRAAEAGVRAAELQVKSVRATRLPTLAMTFTDGQSGSTPEHNVNTYRIQGSIAVPIYTGGRIRGEVEEAEGALREARAALDQDRSQIETDVRTAISGVEWAFKEVETSTRNVSLSRQEVEFTRSRFVQGISDNTEVVNAQDRLTQADQAAIRARYVLGLARANLARATGAAAKSYVK